MGKFDDVLTCYTNKKSNTYIGSPHSKCRHSIRLSSGNRHTAHT